MSLINDALKKAQRTRNDSPADIVTAVTAGTTPPPPAAPRAPAQKSNTALVLGAGALLIVVLSVIATVFLVNRSDSPKPTAPIAAAPKTTPASTSAPEPAAAAITPAPETKPTPAPTPPPEIITPAPKPAAIGITLPGVAETKPTPPVNDPSAKPPTAPAPVPTATPAFVAPIITAAPPPPKTDERIADFVEAIRLTSIRGAGTDGRVLMNNRVYRVNDVVDRTLGVKLTKIATDSLTFTDANGITYVKNF